MKKFWVEMWAWFFGKREVGRKSGVYDIIIASCEDFDLTAQ